VGLDDHPPPGSLGVQWPPPARQASRRRGRASGSPGCRPRGRGYRALRSTTPASAAQRSSGG
jgi:hypothetical protein